MLKDNLWDKIDNFKEVKIHSWDKLYLLAAVKNLRQNKPLGKMMLETKNEYFQ